MKNKQKNHNWKFPIKIFLFFLFLILVLFGRYCYLALSPTVNDHNIQKFAENRNTVSKTLYAKRGTIYDTTGNILAHNVSSYTLILYLDKSRKSGSTYDYVKDIDNTANTLANILDVNADEIKSKIKKGKKNKKYQIELGTIGKNITEIKKDEIEKANLPGVDFEEEYKRYYPNGDFASYIIGYAKTNETTDKNGNITKEIVGELGIEAKFNETLKGTDGYTSYQQDRLGYKIPDTAETTVKALDGSNIYLTIDASIQRFTETEINKIENDYSPEFAILTVMDAKTGDILASSSSPSFNPNLRNISNYENLLVTTTFEPGSTMKTYTYMCAIEKGTYKGDDTFASGSITVEDATIKDWNGTGFGTITFDKGFEYSSNVGVTNMIGKYIDKNDLKECLNKYGFGKTTGVDIARESAGSLGFKYPVEVANAGFGQGITTTVIQQLQALTIISNNGKYLTPHVVKKIINPNTGKVIYKRKIEESATVASESTITKIKELMYNVVNSDDALATGKKYKIEGFDVIGKTGTAQIASSKGGYLKGDNAYIYSFAGMYPKDDPEIIIYAAIKKPNVGSSKGISDATVNLMKNIAKYKNMFTEEVKNTNTSKITLPSYINKKTQDVKSSLSQNGLEATIIGDGDKVISQYPSKGKSVISSDRIILITNGSKNVMPNIIGYSKAEAIYLMETLGFNYEIDGYGYVTKQSIEAGTQVTGKITITLEEKYKEEE